MTFDKKVLVVDDEVHILHVLSLKIGRAGYHVVQARDGREALEAAQVERPDLILTDLQMPYLSGIEFCQRLRQIPATASIPAILLTARGHELDQQTLDSAGVHQCIDKPFSPQAILDLVERMLSDVAEPIASM